MCVGTGAFPAFQHSFVRWPKILQNSYQHFFLASLSAFFAASKAELVSAESATLAWTVEQLGEEQHKEVVALKAEVRVPRTLALSSTSAALLTRLK